MPNVQSYIEDFVLKHLGNLINGDKSSHFIEFLLEDRIWANTLFFTLVGSNSAEGIAKIAEGKYSNHILRKLW